MDKLSDVDSFTLSASFGPDDLRRYEKQSRTSQQKLVVYLAVVGWITCVFLVGGVAAGISNEPIIGYLAGTIVALGLAATFRHQEDARYRRESEDLVPYDLTVNRSGVMQKIGRTETKYVWSEVEAVERSTDFLEIKTWDGSLFVIPQHAFTDPQEFDLVYEFVTEQQKAVRFGHA